MSFAAWPMNARCMLFSAVRNEMRLPDSRLTSDSSRIGSRNCKTGGHECQPERVIDKCGADPSVLGLQKVAGQRRAAGFSGRLGKTDCGEDRRPASASQSESAADRAPCRGAGELTKMTAPSPSLGIFHAPRLLISLKKMPTMLDQK